MQYTYFTALDAQKKQHFTLPVFDNNTVCVYI